MTSAYDPHKIQQETAQYLMKSETIKHGENKKYILAMFPYPSGQFHMGHARCYTIADVLAKYYRANNYHVFSPMGWDAFGLPAENAAIKHKKHPKEWTDGNIEQMREQFDMMGLHFHWNHELRTCDPDYYKWQQWLFIQMYKKGIAYRKKSTVNWDPIDQTVLANEQVIDGKGWRSGAVVERKEIDQWFLKITEYADELLDGCDTLDKWPEQVVAMQHNWIGKSQGVEITFQVKNSDQYCKVYTTRADTLLGTQALVLAPTHPICKKQAENNEKLSKELERLSTSGVSEAEIEQQEKKGVPIGLEAICPISKRSIPIWAGNYVLMDYGHGAVIMVPAHCERDFAFAKTYNLSVQPVIDNGKNHDYDQSAMIEKGTLFNSMHLDGLSSNDAIQTIAKELAEMQLGKSVSQYRLRDWGLSRQRYWGCPIPIIHCKNCGLVPEKEENLPVVLPTDIEFDHTKGILAEADDFINTTCPKCSQPAKRETDTFDTFFDSSWYYVRFLDPNNTNSLVSKEQSNMLPVDIYIGGIEHAILHLLYARFISRFMHDLGITPNQEPFKELLTQGMVLKDGHKMSKSKGNIVTPSELYKKYGADALRLFIIFAAPPQQNLEWSDAGLEGMHRFLKRVVHYFDSLRKPTSGQSQDKWCEAQQILSKIQHDYEIRQLNTTVAGCMKLFNILNSADTRDKTICEIEKIFLLSLFPLAPHTSSYCWKENTSITKQAWPTVDEEALTMNEIQVIVQINGKKRGQVLVKNEACQEDVMSAVKSNDALQSYLTSEPKRIIYIPNRLINILI